MKRLLSIPLFVIAFLGAPVLSAANSGNSLSVSQNEQPELQLPAVPDSLRNPSDRAAYIIEHFWDNMNWGDSELVENDMFMEQYLATYFDLFGHTSESMQKAVDSLVDNLLKYPGAFCRVLEIADRYLYEPESPVYNEEAYLLLANSVATRPEVDENYAEIYSSLVNDLNKNRVGHEASDFTFIDRAGNQQTLLKSLNTSGSTVVLFYDPDCDACAEAEKLLAEDREISAMVVDGELSIIAVCPYESDSFLWKKHAASLPEDWIVGYSPDGEIDAEQIYVIRTSPSIYIISPDGKIKSKNVAAENVAVTINR